MSYFYLDTIHKDIFSKKGVFLFTSLLITLAVSFFLGGVLVFAQSGSIEQNLSIEVIPQAPEPGEEVSISVESFITDLNRATITWLVGGITHTKGTGVKKITVVAAPLGGETRISLFITTEEGVSIEKTIILQPALVDIVLEAKTYTPPFYKGKALFTAESTVVLTALPQLIVSGGSALNPTGLVYTWKRNGRVLSDISGFGKQSITLVGPTRFQNTRVSVEVSSFGKSLKAKKTIFLSPRSPEVLLYEKHPLRGILYNKALSGTFTLTEQEVSLRAEPYFFSLEDLEAELFFEWSLNGKVIQTEDPQKEVTFRQTEGEGLANLKLDLINFNKLFQDASRSLRLQFGLEDRFSF